MRSTAAPTIKITYQIIVSLNFFRSQKYKKDVGKESSRIVTGYPHLVAKPSEIIKLKIE
jgi:hypothetical protein